MIAFFFTMPMSMMMPDEPVDVEVDAEDHQREQRAERRERQAGENRDRVDEALVQHAEDHVDHEDREQRAARAALLRRLERLRRAREARRRPSRGRISLRDALAPPPIAVPSDDARREVERERHRRELAGVVHRHRTDAVA